MQLKYIQNILFSQNRVIEQIALGGSLQECLNTICEQFELSTGLTAKCSISLLEGEQLKFTAAHSLPKAYCEVIDRVIVGPNIGCAMAVFAKKQVIVLDIEHDILWGELQDIALSFDLRACCLTPILSSENEVLGSFDIYFPTPKKPTKQIQELIGYFVNFSILAIEKERAQQREGSLVNEIVASNETLRSFIAVIPDLGFVIDGAGNYVGVVGDGGDGQIVKADHDFVGSNIYQLMPADVAKEFMKVIESAFSSNRVQVLEYELDLPQGQRTFDARVSVLKYYSKERPDKNHVLWMARDISERKESKKKIKQLAFYDYLTDLPNSRLLIDRIKMNIENVNRHNKFGALLYLDLDDFKRINDSLGHTVGDDLLKQVSVRIKPLIRSTDTLARFSGDEFVILLESYDNENCSMGEAASLVAKKIVNEFLKPFLLVKYEYRIRVSIGICLIEGGDITSEEILRRADTAMYQSKYRGGNCMSFYDPELQKIVEKKVQIEHEIHKAIRDGHLTAYFQPQVDLNGALVGAEALVRWLHPTRGTISPDNFISVAERSGSIHELQSVVLRKSCELINKLIELDIKPDGFSIAINISASQFTADFEEKLLKDINFYSLEPKYFMLEITESMLMKQRTQVIEQMKVLKSIGFRFSIDDFGTGYSSLSYLQDFPVDELKIDRSFASQLSNKKSGEAVIDAIISLSNSFGFGVVAEGVENQRQLDILRRKKVPVMQGYLFARPMPQDEFIAWISRQNDTKKL